MKKIFMFSLGLLGLGILAVSCSSGEKSKKCTADSVEASSVEKNEASGTSAEEAAYRVVDGKIMSESGRPLVVDFYADWCPPCRQMKPVFESLAKKYSGKVDFVSVNVDDEMVLAASYGVESIPCFVFIAPDGKVAGNIIGAVPESEFNSSLKSAFPHL